MQNLNLICVIETVESYLGLWGKRANFGITIAEIQQKVWERRRKSGERENVEFRWCEYRNSSTQFLLAGMKCAWNAQSEKKKKIVTIVAIPLRKMGEKNK